MLIRFSQSLVLANDQAAARIAKAVLNQDIPVTSDLPTFHGAHHALRLDGTHYVYEIDDEVLVKILGIYIRVAEIIGPVIQSVLTAIARIKGETADDLAEIESMLGQVQLISELDARDAYGYPFHH